MWLYKSFHPGITSVSESTEVVHPFRLTKGGPPADWRRCCCRQGPSGRAPMVAHLCTKVAHILNKYFSTLASGLYWVVFSIKLLMVAMESGLLNNFDLSYLAFLRQLLPESWHTISPAIGVYIDHRSFSQEKLDHLCNLRSARCQNSWHRLFLAHPLPYPQFRYQWCCQKIGCLSW